MTLTQCLGELGENLHRQMFFQIVQQDKVISRAVHFPEFQSATAFFILYVHYSSASFAKIHDKVLEILKKVRWGKEPMVQKQRDVDTSVRNQSWVSVKYAQRGTRGRKKGEWVKKMRKTEKR
jgi:hypothetical protein